MKLQVNTKLLRRTLQSLYRRTRFSVEQRSELRAAIGSSIDKLVDALNMIIVCYNKRMYAGEIAPEKAAKCVKAEYAAIGLSTWSHTIISHGGRCVLHAQNPDGAVDR